jgi:transposase InsO family protein
VKTVADALGVSRSNLVEQLAADARPAKRWKRRDDDELLKRIRAVVDERGSYGYRRTTRLVNRQLEREGLPTINHKRVYRVMREHQLLLQRYTGKSTRTHDGVIITLKSNLRWCSDSFEIRCWNGERIQVAFSLDCCDREAMRYVATTGGISGEMIRDLMAETLEHRFGAGVKNAPHPIEWLSDNGPPYTARETCAFGASLGFLVCTTPSYSPESNGMAEAFVKTFKRDYVYLNRLETAATVLAQLSTWFEDYNEVHPHRGLQMRSPREFLRSSAGRP